MVSRGGLDNENNLVLSHIKCNSKRGNAMPELQAVGKERSMVDCVEIERD